MISSKYIILGGGMVAGYAAKEMASRGLKPGELLIVSSDEVVPYERPPLSKSFLAGKDSDEGILINARNWYEKQDIALKLKTTVNEVDLQKKRLRATSGEAFECETLLIATGVRPRKLDCPGADLPNVFYLRSMDDSRKIREKAVHAKKAVVIGGGFIGMEVASVLAQKNIQVTMVVREERLGKRPFAPEISEFFERYYVSRGVQLLRNEKVVSLQEKNGIEVSLSSAGKLSCDMVVAGLGAVPVTEPFMKSGLEVANGIHVNESLETNQKGVFAAGDVSNYPDKIFEKRRRVEHWDNAVAQGQHWAAVVMGERRPFVHVPYFFSDIFDLSWERWGDSEGATQTVTRGEPNIPSFSVWWLKNDRLLAAWAMNRPDEERQVAPEWIQSKQPHFRGKARRSKTRHSRSSAVARSRPLGGLSRLSFLFGGSCATRVDALQRRSLVHGDVIGLLAFDEILGFIFRSMMHVALEGRVPNNFLHYHAANASRFGVPLHAISALEGFRHQALAPLAMLPSRRRCHRPGARKLPDRAVL